MTISLDISRLSSILIGMQCEWEWEQVIPHISTLCLKKLSYNPMWLGKDFNVNVNVNVIIKRDYVTPLMRYRLECPTNRYVFKSPLNC